MTDNERDTDRGSWVRADPTDGGVSLDEGRDRE
jgi:hypothetical protein